MKIVRRFFLIVFILSFVNTLLFISLFWVVNRSLADRDVVKGWFAESGVYEKVISRVVSEMQKEIDQEPQDLQDPQNDDVPDIDYAILARAADRSFTPDVLKESVEAVLDGTYDWLEGDAPQLAFTLDFSEEKQALADNLMAEAEARLAALPECSSVELQTLSDSDPFSATCRPPDTETQQQLARFRDEFVNSEDFLPNPVLQARDIKVETEDGGEQSINQIANDAPAWYQRAKSLLWVLVGLAILSAVAVVFLSARKRNGVRYLSTGTLIVAVIVATLGFAVSQLTTLFNAGEATIQETVAKPLAEQITSSISSQYYTLAIVYGILAVAGFMVLILTRKRIALPAAASTALSDEKTGSVPSSTETPSSEQPADKDDRTENSK